MFGILEFVLLKLFYLQLYLYSLQFTFYLYFPFCVFYGCNIPPQLWMFCPLYSWGSNFDLGTKCNKKSQKKPGWRVSLKQKLYNLVVFVDEGIIYFIRLGIFGGHEPYHFCWPQKRLEPLRSMLSDMFHKIDSDTLFSTKNLFITMLGLTEKSPTNLVVWIFGGQSTVVNPLHSILHTALMSWQGRNTIRNRIKAAGGM